MHPILRNIIAVIAGVAIGGFVNMSLIMVSGSVIPPPEGVDMTTTEGLQAGMHLMETKHFIMPFLAHALGTLVGALLIAIIAANHKMKFALGIGVFYLFGGIVAATMIPSPVWFITVDFVLAYLPMAWIGGMIGKTIYNK